MDFAERHPIGRNGIDAIEIKHAKFGIDIDRVVAHINEIHCRKGMEAAIEIGEYLIGTYFAGNSFSATNRGKLPASYRKLAQCGNLNVSYSFINMAVAIVHQRRQLPAELADQLTLTHHRTLLAARDLDTKVSLAAEAVAGQLTTREFKAKVAQATPKSESARGRPRLPVFAKVIPEIARVAQHWTKEPATASAVRQLSAARTRELVAQCDSALDSVQAMLADLKSIVKAQDSAQ